MAIKRMKQFRTGLGQPVREGDTIYDYAARPPVAYVVDRFIDPSNAHPRGAIVGKRKDALMTSMPMVMSADRFEIEYC